MEFHVTVCVAGLVEFFDVLTQCRAERGSQNNLAVTSNFLFSRCNRLFELSDQPCTRSGEPLQMPAGIVEVLNGVSDRLDFFQTAEPCTQQISFRESRLLPCCYTLLCVRP